LLNYSPFGINHNKLNNMKKFMKGMWGSSKTPQGTATGATPQNVTIVTTESV